MSTKCTSTSRDLGGEHKLPFVYTTSYSFIMTMIMTMIKSINFFKKRKKLVLECFAGYGT